MKNIDLMNYTNFFSLLLVFIILSSGCVSKKKFKELELLKDHYNKEYEALRLADEENKIIKNNLKDNNELLKNTSLELQNTMLYLEKVKAENADLEARYNRLVEQNDALLSTSTDEKMVLQKQLNQFEAELDEKKRELEALQFMLDQRQSNLDGLTKTLEARDQNSKTLAAELAQKEQRINELNNLINSKDAQMQRIKTSISAALNNFTAADLTVTERNNKIYVSLSQNLLFKSGSDQIDWKGKKAIGQVAEVLKNNSDININVEGHTDTDGSADKNWDLSTRRANSVVKVLTGNGVQPERITASGRAFYVPIAPNDTAANKALNRRTEIILSPNLDALYELLN